MHGYFGIGVEGLSKAMNAGSLYRSAHAFGASFVFSIGASLDRDSVRLADTSDAAKSLPFYEFDTARELVLPKECRVVGIELLDEGVDLPSFRHPRCAAYVLGPERGSLSRDVLARCDYTVRIPTRFCVNVGLAGAIVMYDRMLSLGRFARRPVRPGGPTAPAPAHRFGDPVFKRKRTRREASTVS